MKIRFALTLECIDFNLGSIKPLMHLVNIFRANMFGTPMVTYFADDDLKMYTDVFQRESGYPVEYSIVILM